MEYFLIFQHGCGKHQGMFLGKLLVPCNTVMDLNDDKTLETIVFSAIGVTYPSSLLKNLIEIYNVVLFV